MGFRTGSFAKVWEVTPVSDTSTKLRISVSRKNRQTEDWEEDFSGFVWCYGTAIAKKAAQLKKGSRIKIGDCDVTTRYDGVKKITYTNFKLFSFENMEDGETGLDAVEAEAASVDDGEIDDNRLPF